MRRGLSMNKRSQSTPTTRRPSPAWLSHIFMNTSLDPEIPGPITEAKILGQADRAIALAPDYDLPFGAKAAYLSASRRYDEAIRAANAGLAINPNNPGFLVSRASAEISLGRFDEAKSDVQQAIRLSPRDPLIPLLTTQLGDIEIGSGRPEAAIIEYRKSLDAGDHHYWNYANLAASYGLLGKMDEAKPYVAETLRVNPRFTIKWFHEHAEDIQKRTEGLRKAGLRRSER
jgi:adenylate cyclase